MGIWCGGGAAMLSTEWLVSPDTQSRTSAFIDSAFSDIPGDESVSRSSATVSSCDKAGWRELTRLAAWQARWQLEQGSTTLAWHRTATR